MIKDFTEQMKISGTQTYMESSMHHENWKPPPTSIVKLNTDAGYRNDGAIGLGAIVKDEEGNILVAATWKIEAKWPVLIPEAQTIRRGLSLAISGDFQRIVIEFDSPGVLALLKIK